MTNPLTGHAAPRRLADPVDILADVYSVTADQVLAIKIKWQQMAADLAEALADIYEESHDPLACAIAAEACAAYEAAAKKGDTP